MTISHTLLYLMLITGLVLIIIGVALSQMQIGKTWAKAGFTFAFGIACVGAGTAFAILPLNLALGY